MGQTTWYTHTTNDIAGGMMALHRNLLRVKFSNDLDLITLGHAQKLFPMIVTGR